MAKIVDTHKLAVFYGVPLLTAFGTLAKVWAETAMLTSAGSAVTSRRRLIFGKMDVNS